MPDKEFEAKVRDSLETLHLEPSLQVWKAVSERIRTRKRRRILFWLPLGVMLAGMGWWSIWYSRQEAPSGKSAETLSVPATPAGAGLPEGRQGGGDRGRADQGPADQGRVEPGGVDQGGADRGRVEPGGADQGNADQTAGNQPAANEKADGQIKGNRTKARQDEAEQPGAPWTLLAYNTGLPPDPYAFNPLEAFPGAIFPLFPGLEPAKTPKDSAGKPEDSSMKPGKQPAWPKWQSRVYGGGGIAGQGQFARFYTPGGSEMGLSPGSLVTSPGSGSNVGSFYTTAARQPGVGLEAGFEEQYRFARHWKIQAGLEYDYWETAFGKVNLDDVNNLTTSSSSPSSAVYVASNIGQTYVNRYSLFQLPLGISWLMAPSRHWNPTLYTGISLGYLSGRHVLQYTPDSVTYRAAPPDLLRHWSGYWEAGFDVDVYHWGTNLLYLGPVIEYGLSGLQTQGSVKDHLNYAGLRLGIGFR